MKRDDVEGGRKAELEIRDASENVRATDDGGNVDVHRDTKRQNFEKAGTSTPQQPLRARSYEEFESSFRKGKEPDRKSRAGRCLQTFFRGTSPLRLLLHYLPFIDMLRNYDVKKHLLNDVFSGVTVSVLHTGQGLGFAAVAGLPPVHGVYVSFFHLAIYFFFGTSNHLAVGTNVLISALVVTVINRQVTTVQLQSSGAKGSVLVTAFPLNDVNNSQSSNATYSNTGLTDDELLQFKLGVATTMSFLVGIVLCIFAIIRFGEILAHYISPVFLSSFTCASAFHIAASQITYAAFGRGHYIGSYSGPLKLFYILRDLFINFRHINWLCSVCFLVSLTILLAIKIGINKNPKIRQKLFIPVPVDLLVILLFTGLSYALSFENIPNAQSGVQVIGNMSTGLPGPSAPSFYNWTDYIGDAILASILMYLLNFTMANFFKEKYKYTVDYNQEMLAPGLCHVFGSFFSCFPGSTAPPRCFLQDASGGRTRVSDLACCVILLLVIYFIAPSLYYLPFAVVAAMTWASLKRLVIQLRDLKTYWQQDKIDFIAWIVTFTATILLDVQYGMITGIVFHVFTVAVRVQLNNVYVVGKVDDDCYRDINKYESVQRSQDFMVLRFNSPILFVNCGRFVNMILNVVSAEQSVPKKVKALVIDCTHVSFVDTAAVRSLTKLRKALTEQGIVLYFSGCSPSVAKKLSVCNSSLYKAAFLTIRDAELDFEAQKNIASESIRTELTTEQSGISAMFKALSLLKFRAKVDS